MLAHLEAEHGIITSVHILKGALRAEGCPPRPGRFQKGHRFHPTNFLPN
jgi:hypothetical protein